jgi:hypothetical protein
MTRFYGKPIDVMVIVPAFKNMGHDDIHASISVTSDFARGPNWTSCVLKPFRDCLRIRPKAIDIEGGIETERKFMLCSSITA